MNKKQEKAVERIKKGVMETFDLSHGKGEYELKQFTVDDCEYFVSVYAVVGMVGDEGTLAAIYGRNRVHIYIGKRGGLTYPMYKNGKYYTKRFTGFWGVHCDQNH